MPDKHTFDMASLPAISSLISPDFGLVKLPDEEVFLLQIVGPHLLAYETLFKQADTKGKGTIPAVQAANFLKKSGLKESILSEIWDLSDPQGRGCLDKQGFFAALKLISAVQNGRDVDVVHLGLNLPPPAFNNHNTQMPNAIITNSAKEPKEDAEWSIPLAERIKYDQIFHTLDPTNGLLPGNKVKPVLLNSKLPVDVLGHVWDLSDIDGDGSLDKDEFSVAMNLVYKALQKIPVPQTLPPNAIPPSKRKITNSPSTPPPKPADSKSTEAAVLPPAADVKSKDEPTVTWVVTAHAKAQCDELFTKTDSDKDGFVSGAEIKKIFIKSGLPQLVLARIWSLCDTKNLGKLNRDQFALAMYLIQQKVKGVEVPSKLAPEMVPPSARRNSLGDNVPPPGVVFDMSTPGMKEIETLGNEIEQVKSLKQTLEGEKMAAEESVKALENSMSSTQQEIDLVVNAVKQLNSQKTEAQKRLDDLDAKKRQVDKDSQEMEEQHEQMQKKIVDLKDQLANRDNLNKTMEEDLKSKRGELNVLRQQELESELKFEASHRRLIQLSKLLHGSQVQMSQIEFNIEKLSETRKQLMLSLNLYDRMLNNEITEQEALSMGSLTITSPMLNFDLSSFDAMSDMVHTTNEEMEECQAKLLELQTAGDDLEVEDEEQEEPVETKEVEDKVEEAEPWDDVPFAKAQAAQNDPFAIGFVTEVKSPINPEDPFGQGAFAPPGAKPARPSRPPQQKKSSGGAPPSRPRSPVPPRPKSPAPPGRPKSPAKSPKGTPPSRPPAPLKSPNPPSDEEDSFFSQIRGNPESNFADFPSDKFASDYDLK